MDQLVTGLSEALLTAKDWMTPAMIRELCLGGAQADIDTAEADEAWGWVRQYLKRHGVYGAVMLGALVGLDLNGNAKFAPDVPAPEIPEPTKAALTAIGGTTYLAGLERISMSTNQELTFLKRDFVAAYGRARRLQ